MDEKELLANSVVTKPLLLVDGVVDVIDPVELNQQIIVMESGKRYRLIVEKEE